MNKIRQIADGPFGSSYQVLIDEGGASVLSIDGVHVADYQTATAARQAGSGMMLAELHPDGVPEAATFTRIPWRSYPA